MIRIPTCLLAAVMLLQNPAGAPQRFESFDLDPGWDGRNNRATEPGTRHVRQHFGWRATSHFGAAKGEIGGTTTPAAEPAYYAKRLPRLTFEQPFSASGRFLAASPKFHVLLGFFNHASTNEWRTPNSAVLRLQGRGDYFIAYLEYCTSKWRAGGDSPRGFVDGSAGAHKFALGPAVHTWSLRYDPAGAGGRGALFAAIDGVEAECDLAQGHRSDGANFDRFGMLNVVKSADDSGDVWIDDLTINGVREPLHRDPGWEARGNHTEFDSNQVRPRFDFGWSPTHYAGGEQAGEIGGTVYRGDGRYSERIAYYGARTCNLSPAIPLHAEGRVALLRGVSDSTTLLGFFNSTDSIAQSPDQALSTPSSFLGIAVEGPSSEGFYVYPACRIGPNQLANNRGNLPRILPDGRSHMFTLDYTPPRESDPGSLTLSMDGITARLDLPQGEVLASTRFDRFGIVTTSIDGNAQRIYFDDLRFTSRESK
jgi:hypothetical protein